MNLCLVVLIKTTGMEITQNPLPSYVQIKMRVFLSFQVDGIVSPTKRFCHFVITKLVDGRCLESLTLFIRRFFLHHLVLLFLLQPRQSIASDFWLKCMKLHVNMLRKKETTCDRIVLTEHSKNYSISLFSFAIVCASWPQCLCTMNLIPRYSHMNAQFIAIFRESWKRKKKHKQNANHRNINAKMLLGFCL